MFILPKPHTMMVSEEKRKKKESEGKEKKKKKERREKNTEKQASPSWKASMEKKEMRNWINITTCKKKYSNTTIAIEKAIQLMKTSPRDLVSKLQQHSSPQAWKLRTGDLAVQEILWERKAAIETGKLKGRRLFKPKDRGRRTVVNDGGYMGQESGERSLSYDYSMDESYSSSSSSLPCLSCDSVDKDEEVKEVEAEDVCNIVAIVENAKVPDCNGRRYIVFLHVIAAALLIVAMYLSWARSFEDHEVILAPT